MFDIKKTLKDIFILIIQLIIEIATMGTKRKFVIETDSDSDSDYVPTEDQLEESSEESEDEESKDEESEDEESDENMEDKEEDDDKEDDDLRKAYLEEYANEDYEGEEEYDEEEYHHKSAEYKKKRKELQDKYRSLLDKFKYSYEELYYLSNLKSDEFQSILALEEKRLNHNYIDMPIRFKILKSDLPLNIKSNLVNRISYLQPGCSEFSKFLTYTEAVLNLPVNKYKDLPVTSNDSPQAISKFLKDSRENIDKVVFGHINAKDHIIRLLAQWISNPISKGLVIGIEGGMGVGKTSLVKDGICKALGIPFGFIPLGGISDGSYLVGHSYTYEGAKHGKIADILMNTKFLNTILFFDELDKVSDTKYGEEIINTLIHITDSTQNQHFRDKYFSEVEIDLSRSLIVFSYNDASLINPILKDRMVTIKTSTYSIQDKIEIARDYLIPEILKQFIFTKDNVDFSDEMIKYIIRKTTEEKGVRNLKRNLEKVYSILNLKRILHDDKVTFPFKVREKDIDTFLKGDIDKGNDLHNFMYV